MEGNHSGLKTADSDRSAIEIEMDAVRLARRAAGQSTEPAIDPNLPIIDPHHHFWDATGISAYRLTCDEDDQFCNLVASIQRFGLNDLVACIGDHNVRATMFMECSAMYRKDGPPQLRSLGEAEFVRGIAAMSASGSFGPAQVCAGYVGWIDLSLGAAAGDILDAHLLASNGRLRGIRQSIAADEDPSVMGFIAPHLNPDLFDHPDIGDGLRELSRRGLVLDTWALEPQLRCVEQLARRTPETTICVNHCGTPLGIGRYRTKREQRFDDWRRSIRALATLPNVVMKLGGLGMPYCGFDSYLSRRPATSAELALEWRPYIETCVEAFGAERCMYESNYPSDAGTADYGVIWNAFKTIAAGCTDDVKTSLFSATAAHVYRLDGEGL